jgi:hypothetical protein
MRKLIAISLLSFISLSGFSQIIKPLYPYVKGKLSFSAETNLGFSNNRTMYSLKETAGYFAANNFLTGVTASQTFSGNFKETDYLSNSVGVFGKYYFGNAKLKPWISTGIEFKSTLSELSKNNEFIIPVALGLEYAINERISLELGFYNNFSFKPDSKIFGIYPMLGIRIRI